MEKRKREVTKFDSVVTNSQPGCETIFSRREGVTSQEVSGRSFGTRTCHLEVVMRALWQLTKQQQNTARKLQSNHPCGRLLLSFAGCVFVLQKNFRESQTRGVRRVQGLSAHEEIDEQHREMTNNGAITTVKTSRNSEAMDLASA